MSLCYPWTPPWWHFQTPLILCSGLGVHLSDWHRGEFFRKHFTDSSRDLGFGVSTGFGFSSWHWQLPSAPVVCPPGPSSRQEQLGLGAELWDVAVLPCSRVCCRGRLSRGSASSGKRWGRESKTGSVSNQSLLMLELPNSVFTHQGLRLMVIYSHFLVNN